ncbi:hypothetical protein AWW66_24710 [Micromonospora rosaria]|uniref:Uncharacterized protein n=1 Tax=Micromonospora rosaria TaxID=47874 RepID=A0A136PLV6_9ACTN|nr:hypothetical protein [Micromonospora rosaria]KXK59348.1 hypothetical protein AWW66_24710 [Micromonospora rosaria]
MRWLQRVLGKEQVQPDPGRQEAMLHEIRHRFGPHIQRPAADQAETVRQLLDGDDGLAVAARIVHEAADEAQGLLLAQAADLHRRTGYRLMVDRRNYRPLWREAAAQLRWPLFALPGGLHPYVQVAAAVTVLGERASRLDRITDPQPLLARLFELFDLTTSGWEYARVRVDTDGATLALRLISTGRQVIDTMSNPPPLPLSVRELMRRNNTVAVHDPAGGQVVGGLNPGAELRVTLLT